MDDSGFGGLILGGGRNQCNNGAMTESISAQQQDLLHKAERQAQVVEALRACLPEHALLWQGEDTTPYECDGLSAYRQRPLIVALPETETQVQAVLRACHALEVPVVARGAGTGLLSASSAECAISV